MTNKEKLAYLAGFVDGEGCITLGRCKKGKWDSYHCDFIIANTDERVMRWIVREFGGTYYTKKPGAPQWKPVHRWYAKRDIIVSLLTQLRPLLLIKRRQATIALKFLASRKRGWGSRGITSEEWRYRDKLIRRNHELNKVGPK